MAITLNATELETLRGMEAQAQGKQIGFWQIYQWLGDLLETKGVSQTDSSLLWLRGATEANAGRGAMAALIRSYTDTQYQIRYGSSVPPGKMQEASDAVAQNLINDLLGRNAPQWPEGQVPDITRIAVADARAVGHVLFNADIADTAAELQQNSAWSGALLFSLLRSDQTGRLMSTGSSASSIDTLNDWRDVLYAYRSYEAGFSAARSALLFETPEQASVDEKAFGATAWGYIKSSSSALSIKDAIVLGTDNPTLKAAFKVIGDVGQNKFLDMLMGAAVGKSLLGSTGDANFTSKAGTFFNAYGSTLQTIGAVLLPTDATALAAKARTDVNARAALAALSVVSVNVSTVTAEQFSLYDPATGQGHITQNWLTDRATFTANNYKKLQGLGGIVNGSENLRYYDAASKTEVLVGAGSAQRVQYLFGGDAADTLTGQGFADHLYGGAGNETLDGKGGNDYLQAGSGNDTLIGGMGDDTLVGGSGIDTFQFSTGDGKDTLINGNAQSTIVIDGATLTGGKAVITDGKLWKSADGKITYALLGASGNYDLAITYGNGDAITVKNYTSGALGISLQDGVAIATTDPVITNSTAIAGKAATAIINGTGINYTDYQEGVDGAANINGNNVIGGGGQDYIFVDGNGDNVISANGGQDIIYAGNGNNRIYAGAKVDLATAIDQAKQASASSLKGNFITVGSGNNKDLLVGAVAMASGTTQNVSGSTYSDVIDATKSIAFLAYPEMATGRFDTQKQPSRCLKPIHSDYFSGTGTTGGLAQAVNNTNWRVAA